MSDDAQNEQDAAVDESGDEAGTDEAGGAEAEDEATDGGRSGEGSGDEGGSAPGGGEPDEQRLEDLGEHIRQARSKAEEVFGEPGETFHESGEVGDEQDDQTIAPPG